MYDTCIIGAGPSGIAASIYLKRAGFNIILFEKNEIGGLLRNANLVENYPGFPNGISGVKLCDLMKEHLEKWGIKTLFEKITDVSYEKDTFIISSAGKEFQTKSVIIATGTKTKKLGIHGENDLIGEKIFYEVRDLLKIVKPGDKCIIIGGGDAGFDYALNLADNDVIVEIFFKSDEPRCLPLLEERVRKKKNINLNSLMIPEEFKEKNGKIETFFKSSKNKNDYSETLEKKVTAVADFILIACGRIPDDEISLHNIEKNNINGFYFAGDINTGKFRQVGIAIGEGITAAMKIEAYLREIKK